MQKSVGTGWGETGAGDVIAQFGEAVAGSRGDPKIKGCPGVGLCYFARPFASWAVAGFWCDGANGLKQWLFRVG